MEVPDQVPIWDIKHENGDHEILRGNPSPLAMITSLYITERSHILELGCGVGRDAEYFAKLGNHVLATDGSTVVVEQDKERIQNPNIEFEVLKIHGGLELPLNTFDMVYANLSLHYFSKDDTESIFESITKSLKPNGLLAFACKSSDSLHESGQELESGVFVSPTGATFHFFTKEYCRVLTENRFSVMHLEEVEEEFNGRHSTIIQCIARKL